MARVFVIDNYDSFTFNVVQALRALGADVLVAKHDEVTVAEVGASDPDGVVISPGPCAPADAGISIAAVRELQCPILGICLGHQAIAEAFGAKVVQVEPIHGKASPIEHDGTGIYQGLPSPLLVGRYHSLAVDEATLPDDLVVTSRVSSVVMGLRHRQRPIEGLQFHPESVLTPQGASLFANWLRFVSK